MPLGPVITLSTLLCVGRWPLGWLPQVGAGDGWWSWGGVTGRQRPRPEEGLGWGLRPWRFPHWWAGGVGRRTLQALVEVAQGGCRMQPGCPPLSADMPLGSQPIQGACGAQMPAVSVAATPPPCTHRELRVLQTECSQCSQDPVWGSFSAASLLFKFFLFELQKWQRGRPGHEATSQAALGRDDPAAAFAHRGMIVALRAPHEAPLPPPSATPGSRWVPMGGFTI